MERVPHELPTAGIHLKMGGTNAPANGGFRISIYKPRASPEKTSKLLSWLNNSS